MFGAGQGTCAEYASVPEERLALKPSNLTFAQAAAVPIAALAALHGLRDAGRMKPGQHVLINGASGGVGTFAVQVAKALGAEVTGVASAANVDMVRSIGADHVIAFGITYRYAMWLQRPPTRPIARRSSGESARPAAGKTS